MRGKVFARDVVGGEGGRALPVPEAELGAGLELAALGEVGVVEQGDKAKTRLDKLSGGQQQKIQLGVTIMGDPELLILDEPTKGFDPVNRRLLMNIIEERRKAGATIIYVTHQMEEVERLCDRLILLKDGRAAAYGTLAEVKKQFGGASMDDIFVKVYGGEKQEVRHE